MLLQALFISLSKSMSVVILIMVFETKEMQQYPDEIK